MKKYILTLFAAGITLPLFAFDFNNGNFEINTGIKAEIKPVMEQEIINVARENKIQYAEYQIISEIRNEMKTVKKTIDRNANMRNRFPNKKFIKEQKEQQIRYENMAKWDIPTKIFDYIKENFNLQHISFVRVVCTYVNNTAIDVHFSYDNKGAVVTYTYTETPWQPSITHKIYK